MNCPSVELHRATEPGRKSEERHKEFKIKQPVQTPNRVSLLKTDRQENISLRYTVIFSYIIKCYEILNIKYTKHENVQNQAATMLGV